MVWLIEFDLVNWYEYSGVHTESIVYHCAGGGGSIPSLVTNYFGNVIFCLIFVLQT